MAHSYAKNSKISWKWGQGKATGKIIEVYHSKARKVIKGNEITRNGSKSNPAYLIEQEDGALVLKLHSEIDSSSK